MRGARGVLGRSEDRLAEAREYCRENGFEGIAVKCDVLDKESCDRARDEILEKWGTVDALVNGAGGNLPGAVVPPDKTVFDIDPAQWSEVLNLNLGGTLIPTLSFCRHFEKTGAGAVVNFSSMTAQSAVTRVLGYSNAKAGVDNLTKWLAVEFAKKSARVCASTRSPRDFHKLAEQVAADESRRFADFPRKGHRPQDAFRQVRRARRGVRGGQVPVFRRRKVHYGNGAADRRRVLVLLRSLRRKA